MKQLHYFQHVVFENLGVIEDWAVNHDFAVTSTHFYKNEPIAMPANTDWLVIMGGPMGVYDQDKYPWLAQEKKAIEQAINDGKVVIGICLGAQLVADVLGASVRSNAFQEVGWFPVYLDGDALDLPVADVLPFQWNALHWHGDTFDIPEGARLLARSSGCRNQGFVYGDRVIGLQFHVEVTRNGAAALIKNCSDDLNEDEFVTGPEEILASDAPFEESHQVMIKFLDFLNALS